MKRQFSTKKDKINSFSRMTGITLFFAGLLSLLFIYGNLWNVLILIILGLVVFTIRTWKWMLIIGFLLILAGIGGIIRLILEGFSRGWIFNISIIILGCWIAYTGIRYIENYYKIN